MSNISGKLEITGSIKSSQSTSRKNRDNLYRPEKCEYINFKDRVKNCPYLVEIEQDCPNLLKKNTKQKKKEIISYKANRDELFIEKPARPKMPIDTKANLEEPEKIIQKADLGIQSDEIDYIEPNIDYVPMKIGIDVGTEIHDTDLFIFDKEVVPLLTVIVGKTLEQSLNELSQEDELENLRKAKAMYMKRNEEENMRIRNLENREIQKKFNIDSKKEKRVANRELKKKTQSKMISRVMGKYYLKKLCKFSLNDLLERGQFKKYTSITIKDKINKIVKCQSENLSNIYLNLRNFIDHALDKQYQRRITKHSNSVIAHKEYVKKMKAEAERRKIEEQERKKKEEEDRKERRKQRKIVRIGNEIKEDIISTGTERTDILSEDFNEMDNHFNTASPFTGIYGGFMGMMLTAFSICKRDYMNNESLYTQENIVDCISIIFNEMQGVLNLYFTKEAGDQIKEIIKASTNNPTNVDNDEDENEEKAVNLNDLKTLELDQSVWEKISEVLSNVDNNSDYLLKNFIEEFSQSSTSIDPTTNEEFQTDPYISKEFYGLIIKALFDLIDKGNFLEHFNFIFEEGKENVTEEGEEDKKEEEEVAEAKKAISYNTMKDLSLQEKLNNYDAICMIEMAKTGTEYIRDVEYNKSSSKKKAVLAPDLENVIPIKAYNISSERHTVLIYDRVAEFILRNKIFESILAQNAYFMGTDPDTQSMFNGFNESYDQMINGSNINKLIHIYHYPPEEEKKVEEEGEEEQTE